jgi:RNA-directed DNA polymerase
MVGWTAISKGGGRVRHIYVPDAAELRADRTRLPRLRAAAMLLAPHAHGGVPGRSPVTAAREHVGYRYTLTADLASCFDHISPGRVPGWAMGGRYKMPGGAVTVAPQGLPSSPAVCDIALAPLDRAIADWCDARIGAGRWAYTRYVDDLAVSADDLLVLRDLRAALPGLAALVGQQVAAHKVHLRGGAWQRRVVVGLSVGDDVRPTRDTRRRLRAALHGAACTLRDAWLAQSAGVEVMALLLLVAAAYRMRQAAGLSEWAACRAPCPISAAMRAHDAGGADVAALIALRGGHNV